MAARRQLATHLRSRPWVNKQPYYPAFLDLRDQPCVVVGGGPVSERKVHGLLGAGAKVRLVSPEATQNLAQLGEAREVRWDRREYMTGDLQGAHLAIAASSNAAINKAVSEDARGLGILVNVADDPEHCTFIAPSIVTRGSLTVAVSTGGKSPAVARRVREELENWLPREYGSLLELAADVRVTMKAERREAPADAWQASLSHGLLDLIREGREDEARERLYRALLAGAPQA